MPTLTEADIAVMRAIGDGTPTSNKHMLRLELMGLVCDRAGGPRLTEAGRRALESWQPRHRVVVTEVAREAGVTDITGSGEGRRARPRKERVNNLF